MCSCGKYKRPNAQQMVEAVGSVLPFLEYTFCAYQDQFQALFSNIGIDITKSDLPDLAKYWESGTDKNGSLIINGNPVSWDTQAIIDQIDTSKKPVKNNCAIA